MSDQVFRRAGLGYVLELPDLFTTFTVDHIQASRDGLHGILFVRTAFPGIKTNNGVMLATAFNITSQSIRKSVAKTLQDRAPFIGETYPLDWFGFLEALCQGVMVAESEGTPIESVGTLPEAESPPPLVHPIVERHDSTILYGDSGIGKSMFAIALALTVASGTEVIAGLRPMAKPMKVLYLDYETNRDQINRRIRAICNGVGIPPIDIFYRRCFEPLHHSVESLSREIADRDIQFIVCDPVGYAMGFNRDGGDPAEPALRLFNALRIFGTTNLLVDHVGKADVGTEGHKKPYGSSYKSHAARATWEFRVSAEPDETNHIAVYHTKGNNTEKYAPLGFSYFAKNGLVSWAPEDIEDAGLMSNMTQADRIAVALRAHALRIEEIASRTGLSNAVVRAVLSRYKGQRWEPIATGDWKLIEGGKSG